MSDPRAIRSSGVCPSPTREAEEPAAARDIASAPQDGETEILASTTGKVWFQAIWDDDDGWVTFNRYLERDVRVMGGRKWEPRFWVPLPADPDPPAPPEAAS